MLTLRVSIRGVLENLLEEPASGNPGNHGTTPGSWPGAGYDAQVKLVGREQELAAAERAVKDAQDGSSRALGVLGEAGIGKSALLIATRERAAAAGMLVLEGRGAEHEQDVPFGVVVDALDDHVASLHPRRVESLGHDLGAVLPAAAAHASAPPASDTSAAERFRYHRALRALIELLARERPVTLLLDDLHWADDASVELVLHLLRRPPPVHPTCWPSRCARSTPQRGCSTPPARRPTGPT